MEAQEILNVMKAQALKDLEILLKNQMEVGFDEAAKLACEKMKAAIPGQVDDVVIDMVSSPLIAELKKALLAQVEKVSA